MLEKLLATRQQGKYSVYTSMRRQTYLKVIAECKKIHKPMFLRPPRLSV